MCWTQLWGWGFDLACGARVRITFFCTSVFKQPVVLRLVVYQSVS